MKKDPFDFEQETLDNGIKIFYKRHPRNETEIRVLLKAGGARYDPVGKEGCAHLLEHLMTRGTARFNEITLDDYVLKHNLNWNAYTDFESIGFEGHCWTEIKALLFMLGEFLGRPKFEDKLLEKEKKVVIREMEPWQKIKNWVKVEIQTSEALYGKHPFSRIIKANGTLLSVNSLTLDDVVGHWKRFSVAPNLSLIVITPLKLKTLKTMIEEYFDLPDGKIEYPESPQDFPKPAMNLFIYSRSEILGIKKTPEYEEIGDSLRMCAVIPTSKAILGWEIIAPLLKNILYRRLRYELGWIYGLSVKGQKWRDISSIEIGIESVSPGRGINAKNLIEKEISEFEQTKKIFELLKKNRLKELKNYQGSPRQVADEAMSDVALYDRIITLRETMEGLENFTFQEASEWVRRWLTPERILTRIITS